MIKPTPGRVVWFYPSLHAGDANFASPPEGEPCAATIARVWSDTMVNLMVIDANGVPHSRTSVSLVQDGSEKPHGFYCTWMPYQVGQALQNKAVEAAAQAAAKAPDLAYSQAAERMWAAYSAQGGGKTFDGRPLPLWGELGDERQACWVAAAKAA